MRALERIVRKTFRTRDEAKADVFDYIERFYNPKRRRSTLGNLSPMELCALHAEILIVAQPL
jgi:transposase InsO family protein